MEKFKEKEWNELIDKFDQKAQDIRVRNSKTLEKLDKAHRDRLYKIREDFYAYKKKNEDLKKQEIDNYIALRNETKLIFANEFQNLEKERQRAYREYRSNHEKDD